MEEVEDVVIQIVLQLHKVEDFVNPMAVERVVNSSGANQQDDIQGFVSSTEVGTYVELKSVERQLITVDIVLHMVAGGVVG